MSIGILDREGKLHECASYDHLHYAKEIVQTMNVTVKNGLEAEEYLQKLGWVIIRTRDVYGLIGYLDNQGNFIHLSDEQKKWLLEEYARCNSDKQKSIDDMLDMDRF